MKKDINKFKYKAQNGVSLITLVITIIVIIILATLAMRASDGAIDEAAIADYRHELKGVEVSVSSERVSNQKGGIGEEFKEQGFYPVIIENPPENFEGFDSWDLHGYEDGEIYGYVVDLENAKEDETKRGFDYKKYKTFEVDKVITFGKKGKNNDVYIYDATGKVYYAKGYYVEDGVYYSDVLTKDGPIIKIEREYDAIANVVNLTIKVVPEENGDNIILRIDGVEIAKEADDTYKYTVTQNGTYRVSAEEGNNISKKKVVVNQIKAATYVITYHFDGVAANQTQAKVHMEEIRLIPPEKVLRTGYILEGFSKNSSASTLDYKVGQIFSENRDTDLYAVWREGTPKEYTINFNPNGGKNPPSPIRKTEGETIQLPLSEVPIKEGFVFKGWSKDSENVTELYAPGSEYAEDGNAVLFAIWEAGEIRVDIQTNPIGAGSAIKTGNITAGNTIYLTATANRGYVFDKWTFASSSANVNLADVYASTTKFTMPTGVVSLIANFKETEYDYTIKYNSNNGTGAPETQYKRHDEDIRLSSIEPTRRVFAFAGWTDTLSSNTIKYMPGDIYTANKNVTLYAIWTGECIVTFDPNGGTVDKTEMKIKVGEPYIGLPTPTKKGYTFDGWFTEKNDGEKITDSSIMPKIARQTLYAHWTANTYTVTLDPNGGTFEGDTIIQVTYDKTYGELPTPTREGYTFIGWYDKNGREITSETKVDIIENSTITAKWRVNLYTITFDSNGGSAVTPITQSYGTTITPPAAPIKTGYIFNGWTPELPSTIPANNMTLVANWELDTYTISYELNGGTVTGNPNSYTIEDNDIILKAPSKVGYTFSGWTGSNGTTAQISVTIPQGSSGNKTYRANWTANTNTPYIVEHWQQTITGGDTPNDTNYTLKETLNETGTTDTTVTPAIKNYPGFTAPSTQMITIAPDGSTVLKYYYKRNNYTVTFNANGGTITGSTSSQTTRVVKFGSTYGATTSGFPSATMTGYKFLGWYTEKKAGKNITSSTNVDTTAQNQILYAQWLAEITPITNLKVTNVSGAFSQTVTWTNPTVSAYYQTKVLRKTGSAPTSPTDGTVVYTGTGTSKTVTGLSASTTYYYAAFALTNTGTYAENFPTASLTTASSIEKVLYYNGTSPTGLLRSIGGSYSSSSHCDRHCGCYVETSFSTSYGGTNCIRLTAYGENSSYSHYKICDITLTPTIDFTNISKIQITACLVEQAAEDGSIGNYTNWEPTLGISEINSDDLIVSKQIYGSSMKVYTLNTSSLSGSYNIALKNSSNDGSINTIYIQKIVAYYNN